MGREGGFGQLVDPAIQKRRPSRERAGQRIEAGRIRCQVFGVTGQLESVVEALANCVSDLVEE